VGAKRNKPRQDSSRCDTRIADNAPRARPTLTSTLRHKTPVDARCNDGKERDGVNG
jgi:hypothetical protein